jgi:hypothetical protein
LHPCLHAILATIAGRASAALGYISALAYTLESVTLSVITNQITAHRVPTAVSEGVGKPSSRPRSRVIGKHAPRIDIAGNARSVGESDSACALCSFCVVPLKSYSRSPWTSGVRLPGEYVFHDAGTTDGATLYRTYILKAQEVKAESPRQYCPYRFVGLSRLCQYPSA